MNYSGVCLGCSGPKFMQLSKLLRLSKIHIISLFFRPLLHSILSPDPITGPQVMSDELMNKFYLSVYLE